MNGIIMSVKKKSLLPYLFCGLFIFNLAKSLITSGVYIPHDITFGNIITFVYYLSEVGLCVLLFTAARKDVRWLLIPIFIVLAYTVYSIIGYHVLIAELWKTHRGYYIVSILFTTFPFAIWGVIIPYILGAVKQHRAFWLSCIVVGSYFLFYCIANAVHSGYSESNASMWIFIRAILYTIILYSSFPVLIAAIEEKRIISGDAENEVTE